MGHIAYLNKGKYIGDWDQTKETLKHYGDDYIVLGHIWTEKDKNCRW